MNDIVFPALPAEIQAQITALLDQDGTEALDEKKEHYAKIWQTKYELFVSQIHTVGMELVQELGTTDTRGAILLTYSGSLISLGPQQNGSRWLEYASIKFRSDVPDYIRGQSITVNGPITCDAVAEFSGSPLKKSSSVYRIAVCPEGTSESDQEQRIREATIYLTNGFIKINRTQMGQTSADVDQFTVKSIVSFLAKKHGLTQNAARAVLDDYLSVVEAGVLLGERVTVGKLGSMTLKLQAAKKARVMKNIQTGEDILVPAKPATLVPKFVVS
ncbi:MAG TPA: HU family DNA-binding protein, partial [Treponemataceae bacterium]|nr:HU family DNA-binding protein [Treponemataceae bacterium]